MLHIILATDGPTVSFKWLKKLKLIGQQLLQMLHGALKVHSANTQLEFNFNKDTCIFTNLTKSLH